MNPTTTQPIGNSNTSYDGTNMGSFNVPNTNTLGTVNNSGNLNLPPAPIVPNAVGSLTSFSNQLQLDAQNKQAEADKSTNNFNDLLKQYLGQGADQSQLNQQYDTAGLTQKYRDLQALQAQQTARYIQGLNDIELAKNTRQEANAQSVMLNRQHGIDALLTGAQLQSAQGNLEYAQNLIKNALDLKYEPIKAQLEYQKEIVSQLNTKAATAQTRAFDTQIKQIEQQQKEQENIYNLGTTVAKNNAPSSVVAQINKAKTFAEASDLAAPYMVSPADKLDLQLKRIQIAKASQDLKDARGGGLLSIDDAQKLGVPYGTTKAQAIALQGQAKPLNELQTRALTSAQELLGRITQNTTEASKTGVPNGNIPVGIGRFGITLPGSSRADFKVNFNNLTSLLSLDNVKYLKGQGQVSDAERKLLADASARLRLSQSLPEFQKNLTDIINVFEKASPEYQYSQSATSLLNQSSDPYSTYTSQVLAK